MPKIRPRPNPHQLLADCLALSPLITQRLVVLLALEDCLELSLPRQQLLVRLAASLEPSLLPGLQQEACSETQLLNLPRRREAGSLGRRNNNHSNNLSHRLRSGARPLQRKLILQLVCV